MSSWIVPRVIRGNRGDLLSRWGILATLAQLDASAPAVFCSDPAHIPQGTGPTLPYGSFYNLIPDASGWRALRRAEVVLWTGGLDLQDDSSLLKLPHMLAQFLLYRAMGLRIVVVMQGAGPLTTSAGRFFTRQILRQVDRFLVRDPGSYELLRAIAPKAPLTLCHDGIFLDGLAKAPVPSSEQALAAELAQTDGRPLIGVNIRQWFHFASDWVPYQFAKARYRARAREPMARLSAAAVSLIRLLRRDLDARVVLVSMYEPDTEDWEDDLPLLRELKAALAADNEVRLLEQPISLAGFFALIGGLDLMIGARLHSTLTALRAGGPAIHLNYTLKGRDIFSALGFADQVVDLDAFMQNPERVGAMAMAALRDPSLRDRVCEAVARAVGENKAALAGVVREFGAGSN